MLKIYVKKFSTSVGKMTTLNSLNKYVTTNFENFTKDDFVTVMNKFQELEAKDPNAKLKLYDMLDYIMYDEKKLSDDVLLKTVMRTLLSVNLYDKIYWDHFKQILLKHNLLFESVHNYLDYLKVFSIVNYEDEELWKIFEEYFVEMNRSFDIEAVQNIALCFGNNKKGSKQFWVTMFDTFDMKNQKYADFILNFSVCLCGFLQSKIISTIDQKLIEYFCTYLNFSADFLNKTIQQGTSVEKIDLVYSLFPHIHKTYYIDKLHVSFPTFIEKNILKSLVETLENFLKNYLDKNINKLEVEDFEQISKILKYSTDNKLSLGKLKPAIFVKIFTSDLANIKNYYDIYNFLNYFNSHNIKEDKLKTCFAELTVWERFIEAMHTMTVDQLINLTVIMKNYHVSHLRIWIFLQNFFRLHVKNIITLCNDVQSLEKTEEGLKKVETLLSIFKDDKLMYEDYVLLPFVIFLETSRDKLNIIKSYNNKLI